MGFTHYQVRAGRSPCSPVAQAAQTEQSLVAWLSWVPPCSQKRLEALLLLGKVRAGTIQPGASLRVTRVGCLPWPSGPPASPPSSSSSLGWCYLAEHTSERASTWCCRVSWVCRHSWVLAALCDGTALCPKAGAACSRNKECDTTFSAYFLTPATV